VDSLLNEINLSIYALVYDLEHGGQLSSSERIVSLFEQMEDFGMSAEMPEVCWDADGHVWRVRIGRVEGVL